MRSRLPRAPVLGVPGSDRLLLRQVFDVVRQPHETVIVSYSMTYSRPLWPTPLISATQRFWNFTMIGSRACFVRFRSFSRTPSWTCVAKKGPPTFGPPPSLSFNLACLGWFPGESLPGAEKGLFLSLRSFGPAVVQRNATPKRNNEKNARDGAVLISIVHHDVAGRLASPST